MESIYNVDSKVFIKKFDTNVNGLSKYNSIIRVFMNVYSLKKVYSLTKLLFEQ